MSKYGFTDDFFTSRVCVVSALRIRSVAQIDNGDLSYSAATVAIWSNLEPCLSIVCACSPVMQPALMRIWISITCMAKPRILQTKPAEGYARRRALSQTDQEALNGSFGSANPTTKAQVHTAKVASCTYMMGPLSSKNTNQFKGQREIVKPVSRFSLG